MKRHPSLRDLSSDHHHGLVWARRLSQAANNEALTGDAAQGFLRFWATHTNHHFREEEEVLLPAFARYGDPSRPEVVRVLVEHVCIRRLVDDLQRQLEGGAYSLQTIREIGELFRSHIRYEEDTLFPLIEAAMPEDALADLTGRFAVFQG